MKRGKLIITIIFLFISLILLKNYDLSFKNIAGKASFGTTSVTVTIDDRYDVDYDEFDKTGIIDEDGDIPTNFTNMTTSQQQNISKLILRNANYGKIEFIENINISSPTLLDSYINISHNLITLNSTFLPNFNKSATLKFYNLTFTNPRILMNSVICPADICTRNSYLNGILSFNVTHFTSYEAEETPSAPSGAGSTGHSGKTEIIKREIKEPEKPKIIHEPGRLFDVSILIPEKYTELVSDDNLMAQIRIINIKRIGLVDVNIEYLIEDSNKSIIYQEIETKSVENEITYIKDIELPTKMEIGDYMFITKVRYNDDIATAGYPFKIIKKIHLEEPGEFYENEGYYILSGIIILILLFIIIIIHEYLIHKKLSSHLRINEEILIKEGYIKQRKK